MNQYDFLAVVNKYSAGTAAFGLVFILVGLIATVAVKLLVGLGLIFVGSILLTASGFLLRNALEKEEAAKQIALKALMQDLKSPDRSVRLLTIETLREKGWLQDGSLAGADLSGLDLQGASLTSCNFQKTNLKGANLRGADLHFGDLRGADLTSVSMVGANLLWVKLQDALGVTDQQLVEVYILRRATLPDGQVYDGRYRLRGDLDDAGRDRIKSDDEVGLAHWYEVSLEQFRSGQTWAEENLNGLNTSPPSYPASMILNL